MRISDWSSDVCSSDLHQFAQFAVRIDFEMVRGFFVNQHVALGDPVDLAGSDHFLATVRIARADAAGEDITVVIARTDAARQTGVQRRVIARTGRPGEADLHLARLDRRSEEHTSELQSL